MDFIKIPDRISISVPVEVVRQKLNLKINKDRFSKKRIQNKKQPLNWNQQISQYMESKQKFLATKRFGQPKLLLVQQSRQMQIRKMMRLRSLPPKDLSNNYSSPILEKLKLSKYQPYSNRQKGIGQCETILIDFVDRYFKRKSYNARNPFKKHSRRWMTQSYINDPQSLQHSTVSVHSLNPITKRQTFRISKAKTYYVK